jgi:hypothetical protein
MMKIDSMESLKAEIERKKLELVRVENLIAEDFNWMIDELKPMRLITKGVSKMFHPKDGGLVNATVGTGISYLAGKLFLRKSSWISQIIIPLIIKNISSNLFNENKDGLFQSINKLVNKFKNNKYKEDGSYDSSTAHSQY